jgi:hypothetical protein
MAKHSSQRRRAQSKSRTMRRSQKGGDLGGNPASAWGWGMGTLGNGWTQFMNSLTLQPGQNLGTSQSNNIVPVNNVNAQDSQGMIGTNLKGDIPKVGGGKRRRARSRARSSSKRGGNLGSVLYQAVVPGTLFALNQSAKRRNKRN